LRVEGIGVELATPRMTKIWMSHCGSWWVRAMSYESVVLSAGLPVRSVDVFQTGCTNGWQG
jgi:hypothetical protein